MYALEHVRVRNLRDHPGRRRIGVPLQELRVMPMSEEALVLAATVRGRLRPGRLKPGARILVSMTERMMSDV